jgi:aminopeptidase N
MRAWLHALAFLPALALLGAPAAAQRLSGEAVPEHYTLWFGPDLDEGTFDGRATIDVVLSRPSRQITLHAAELAFGEVTIRAAGRTQIARVELDPAAETATLSVPDTMPEGRATIAIAYTGVLNDKLRGFYLSEANGRRYAITQMEPTDARRAFPGFDEPVYKATFDVSLTIDAGDSAIANGRQVSDTPGPRPGTHTLAFARTPRMSTYLVAMLVGDFVCRDGASDGTPIRVCSTPDKLPLTAYALEAAEFQLAFFNEYFGIDYAFGKLDIVAVPDFAAGAMENAGAITFRERLLLIDPATSSLNTRKRVAAIISHELAHQWFGNLVTMAWWDDIWLNEGFATWLANKPLAAWRPEWAVELDDAADTQAALGLDALGSTRAIRLQVETPAEINQVFDGIAYEKTAAVLRMLEHYVGPEAFRRGIASYLTRFAYANAAGEDFWNELTRATGRPLDAILSSFVEQPGAPVLTVRDRCVADRSEVTTAMSRFAGSPGATPPAQTWTFPACMRTGGDEPRCEVVSEPRLTIEAGACGPLVANVDGRGYYLTEYTPEAVRELAARPAILSPVERLGLLGDEWWMLRSGRHDAGVYLDLAAALAPDGAPAITEALAARLATIGGLVGPADQPAYQSWIRDTFGPSLDALGLPGPPGDDDERQRQRATLLALLGVTGNDPSVQRRARELAGQYLTDPRSISGTLAPTALGVAALAGDAALYDRYRAQLAALAAQPEEYYRIFGALASFRDPALVTRTLALAVSPEVRSQDVATLIGGLLARPDTQDAAWAFTRDRWPELTDMLGEFQGLPRIISALGAFCSTPRAEEVRTFFAANPVPSADRAIRQAVEQIESCVALAARQSESVGRWLAAR